MAKYKIEYTVFDHTGRWTLLIKKHFLFIPYWKVVSIRETVKEIEEIHRILTEHKINKHDQ